MILWVIAWALWSITVWYQVVFWYPARQKITGCSHPHGKIREGVPDLHGDMTALVWHCDTCPLQFPLQLFRTYDQAMDRWLWCLPPPQDR